MGGIISPKDNYSWETYKWSLLSKYNSSDGIKTLESSDDAATVRWGANCRIPTRSEFEELRDECTWAWTSNYNGASGFIITGINGKSIFLPASGCRSYYSLGDCDKKGCYWLRSISSYSFDCADGFVFDTGGGGVSICRRYLGFSVRPVTRL